MEVFDAQLGEVTVRKEVDLPDFIDNQRARMASIVFKKENSTI